MFGNHGKSDGKPCGNYLDKKSGLGFPQLVPLFTLRVIHGKTAGQKLDFKQYLQMLKMFPHSTRLHLLSTTV
jgi:hypothetical protein